MDSLSIKKKIKFSPDSGIVTVDEKNSIGERVTYTSDEIQIIAENGFDEITPLLHSVKKVFAGTIIRYEKK